MTCFPEIPAARVQVILPAYNRRDYLAEALESVLAQTYRDHHVLVIDDASTDGTAELAKDYARRLPERVTAFCKSRRGGAADSVNLGIEMTPRAPYVALHNHDDIWMPSKLEAQMEAFRDDPKLGLVATEAAIIDSDGNVTGELFSDHFGRPDLDNAARRIFWEGNCLCAASVVVSRAALDLLDPYSPPDGGCGDMYMWLVISAHMPIAWLAEPLTQYRKGPGQLSLAIERQMWRETYALRDRVFRTDHTLQVAVGGATARRRLDGDALYRANLYLSSGDFADYGWFARQLVLRRSPRLMLLLLFYSAQALLRLVLHLLRPAGDR